MILNILRALFVLLMAGVGWAIVISVDKVNIGSQGAYYTLAGAITLAVLVVCADVLAPRRKLAVFSGTILGIIVGLVLAYGASFVTQLVFDQILFESNTEAGQTLLRFINITIGIVCCYLAVSFIMQTKDDFRFIIPYVEFRRQSRGDTPLVLDTSVLIDARIRDVASTGIFHSQLLVPNFVLMELQRLADSADRLKRGRGRRGLTILQDLQDDPEIDIRIIETGVSQSAKLDVDTRLMQLAKELDARVITTDYNLNKVAQLTGTDVINLNDLANALKPEVLPGEELAVHIVRVGETPGQGVGYLDDGTMVVVENAADQVEQDVTFTVTNMRQTSAGKMIFGRAGDDAGSDAMTGVPTARKRPRNRSRRRNEEDASPTQPADVS